MIRKYTNAWSRGSERKAPVVTYPELLSWNVPGGNEKIYKQSENLLWLADSRTRNLKMWVGKIAVFSTCWSKRFSNSGHCSRSCNVGEILCGFLCDLTKGQALGDVGLLKGVWRKFCCSNVEYRKDTKSIKKLQIVGLMDNVIHVHARRNKRI
jgi:hypothetical protein